jgi:hypothetical protein
LKTIYQKLENHFINKILNAKEEDFRIKPMVFKGLDLVDMGTLGWVVIRVIIHAMTHSAQISHVRFALNNPPVSPQKGERTSWWWASEAIIELVNPFNE